jgi:hypothetical protein
MWMLWGSDDEIMKWKGRGRWDECGGGGGGGGGEERGKGLYRL